MKTLNKNNNCYQFCDISFELSASFSYKPEKQPEHEEIKTGNKYFQVKKWHIN